MLTKLALCTTLLLPFTLAAPSAPAPALAARNAPYAQGTCGISLQAQRYHNDPVNKFWVNIRSMTDNNNQPLTVQPGWQSCQNQCSWGSTLEDRMNIAVVGANDDGIINYLQFYLGAQQWRSSDHEDSGTTGKCKTIKYGDNYNSNGENNEGHDDTLYDYWNLECTYECTYSGGYPTYAG
ncbi:hypothetical protein PRZ48_012658 [Zasmidium cellare]|uniref:Uncharacterized protein n=1 Tax=Zasmidium cellare TaxID=395010 RepID=A0ABR0E622_ZASCE|nr:hypothetical protein PRZ48_012658 [Zasmidium cellare]